MNRVKREELKRKREARKGLSEEEIKALDEREAQEEELMNRARGSHAKMFPEEYDFMYDSYSDSNRRSAGENPMSAEYTMKANERRKKLGVPPLAENGMPPDDEMSFEIAMNLAKEEMGITPENYMLSED